MNPQASGSSSMDFNYDRAQNLQKYGTYSIGRDWARAISETLMHSFQDLLFKVRV